MTTNFSDFLTVLTKIVDNNTNNDIKSTIGDSTSNNRVPSVNQVVRFLKATKRNNLSRQLKTAYTHLRRSIVNTRLNNNSRTDAIDINEFIKVANRTNSTTKRVVTNLLNA